jgi:protein-tyrosine phosphatase
MLNILFVCMGNICRSPALAATLQKYAESEGIAKKLYIDSCGLSSVYLGLQAHEKTRSSAAKRGILIDHRAKLFEESYFELFDYIFAVNKETFRILQQLAAGSSHKAKVYLATEFSQKHQGEEIHDPYYDTEAGFEKVMDIAEDVAKGFLAYLKSSSASALN